MRQSTTVLLIDDDQDMRWAIRNILADAGYAVAEALKLKVAGVVLSYNPSITGRCVAGHADAWPQRR
jgi:DNA-binding NtrC family response regulator